MFDAFWPSFTAFQGTFGQTLTTQVQEEVFDAKVRHFPDSLADATFADNMPESVYRELVSEADKNLPTLYRYLALRKKGRLGITDDLHYYDLYVPIFDLAGPAEIPPSRKSEKIALDVDAIYGPEYVGLLKKGFAGAWGMNVYPHPGKANGRLYERLRLRRFIPICMFNNHDDYGSLTTFVHEWGHAIHTLLDDPRRMELRELEAISTFIAETAPPSATRCCSTTTWSRMQKDDAEKDCTYLRARGLELIRTTFFRQTDVR